MADGQETYLLAIRKALSNRRLDAYGMGRPDDEKLANYFWNLALCEALYPSLHGHEIVLRNALFDAGATVFTGFATRDVQCWLDADPLIILPDERAAVDVAKQRLRDRRSRWSPAGWWRN